MSTFDEHFEQEEIPKHRKPSPKAQQSPKKSNHKHQYELARVTSFRSYSEEELLEKSTVISRFEEDCVFCGKSRRKIKSLPLDVFLAYQSEFPSS